MKKKILWVGEASFLNTGYATYSKEVLSRLHATGKYDIVELACYAPLNDPRMTQVPWEIISVLPTPEQVAAYNSDPINQFGKWKFDEVCLKHRPTHVCDIRDFWMFEFETSSVFRPFYSHVIMPTVDAAPQDEAWIAAFMSADAVLNYSDWGAQVLREQGGGLVKLMGTASPGADMLAYYPKQNKREHKKNIGIDENALIVGTVMRNQKRKLYPDLVNSFRMFLDKAPAEMARRTYLYLHTCWPDVGWDIPRLITEAGIASRCIMTYMCKSCGIVFSSFFQDNKAVCRGCRQRSAVFPNAGVGVSNKLMGEIINGFDAYVQYANCLPPGTEVKLKRGWVPIENVVQGDEAMTHLKRYRYVKHTFKHERGELCKRLTLNEHYEQLVLTKEHPVYSLTNKNFFMDGKRPIWVVKNRIEKMRPVPKFSWNLPTDLQKHDLVAVPIDTEIKDTLSIDLMDIVFNCVNVSKDKILYAHRIYDRHLKIDEVVLETIGLLLETRLNKRGRLRVLASNRSGVMRTKFKTLINFAERVRSPWKILKFRSGMDMFNCADRILYDLVSYLVGGTEEGFPEWIMKLPPEKQKHILIGVLRSHPANYQRDNYFEFALKNKRNADIVIQMLRRNKIPFNAAKLTGNVKKPRVYRIKISPDFMHKSHLPNFPGSCYYDDYHIMSIRKVEDDDYDGEVHNFEVDEDNSYVTRFSAVHNSEGFGMPMVEAAACGVPVFAVDYSAMSDVVRKVRGYPIEVQRLVRECETHCWRAAPNNEALVNQLIDFFKLPESVRARKGYDARKAVEQHYSYDKAAAAWERCIDSTEPKLSWNAPPRVFPPANRPPQGVSNEEFVRWAIVNVLGMPELVNSYLALKLIRDLNWEQTSVNTGGMSFSDDSLLSSQPRFKPFSRESCMELLTEMRLQFNKWEEARGRR